MARSDVVWIEAPNRSYPIFEQKAGSPSTVTVTVNTNTTINLEGVMDTIFEGISKSRKNECDVPLTMLNSDSLPRQVINGNRREKIKKTKSRKKPSHQNEPKLNETYSVLTDNRHGEQFPDTTAKVKSLDVGYMVDDKTDDYLIYLDTDKSFAGDITDYEHTFKVGQIIYLKYKKYAMGFVKNNIMGTTGFINHISCNVFMAIGHYVNVMIFASGAFNLVGSKMNNDAVLIIMILWNYIKSSAIIKRDPHLNALIPDFDKSKPIFSLVSEMINLTIDLPFKANKQKVNAYINSLNDEEIICFYDPTGPPGVKCRMINTYNTRTVFIFSIVDSVVDGIKTSEIKTRVTTIPTKVSTFNRIKSGTLFVVFEDNVLMSGCGICFATMRIHYNKFIALLESADELSIPNYNPKTNRIEQITSKLNKNKC